ncbi:MFS transporter [Piscinibacter sakaiensis]|uniref:MFS transporter n=1 Tax=Piscinibacter sakaiensis TaxID=1547922 RepID=UPI003AACC516
MSAAGFAATAISFGPARMGFGLFVPEFKSSFEMSTPAVGYVSSLGFFGLLVGLLIAQFLLNHRGPRLPVLAGLAAATTGLAIVAAAPNLPVLALGVFLAASSAGFAWTPFNDAVHRKIRDVDRPAALSEISSGTAIGIAAAGVAALGMAVSGVSWRLCWALFALASAAALLANWAALRGVGKAAGAASATRWRDVLRAEAMPLFVTAFVYGTTSAVFISFAPDHLRSNAELPGVPSDYLPALVFICVGVFGLAGLLTGRAKEAIGIVWLVRLLMLAAAASVALVALLPGSWAGLIGSSALQGLSIMMTSALLALWSEKLFPSLPSLSLTAALLATASGSVLGSAVAGALSDAAGARTMFLAAAALPVLVVVMLRARHLRELPPQQPAGMQAVGEAAVR